ncbi:hypothetical protein ACOBQB_16115 [Streptomyces sp. G5(2025)]
MDISRSARGERGAGLHGTLDGMTAHAYELAVDVRGTVVAKGEAGGLCP